MNFEDLRAEAGGAGANESALDRLRRLAADLESRQSIDAADVAVLQAVRETLAQYDRGA